MGFIVLGLGIAVLFQFVLIRYKWKKGMYADVFIDIAMILVLNGIFGGSQLGVISATAGSTLISLWLVRYPIVFNYADILNPQPPPEAPPSPPPKPPPSPNSRETHRNAIEERIAEIIRNKENINNGRT